MSQSNHFLLLNWLPWAFYHSDGKPAYMAPQLTRMLWARRPVSRSVISWLCDLDSIPFNLTFPFCKIGSFDKMSSKSLLILKLQCYLSLSSFTNFTIPQQGVKVRQRSLCVCWTPVASWLTRSRNSSCCRGSASLNNLSNSHSYWLMWLRNDVQNFKEKSGMRGHTCISCTWEVKEGSW